MYEEVTKHVNEDVSKIEKMVIDYLNSHSLSEVSRQTGLSVNIFYRIINRKSDFSNIWLTTVLKLMYLINKENKK